MNCAIRSLVVMAALLMSSSQTAKAAAGTPLETASARVAEQLRAMPEAAAAGEAATARYHQGLVAAAVAVHAQSRRLDRPAFAVSLEIEGRPGLVNPDNLYTAALLSDTGRYRIHGRRGSHALLSLQLLDAYPVVGLGRNLAVIDLDALGIRPGQGFEVFLGGAPREGLWFALPPGAKAVLARQTFADWQAEAASRVEIERLDQPAPTVAPEEAAATAGDYLLSASRTWNEVYLAGLKRLPVNSLPAPRPSDAAAGGLGGQVSVMARYRVGPGEALVITVKDSGAPYQALQVGDPWFVTPHFVRHASSLNRAQASRGADGSFRFVLSLEDPGVADWIDLAGFGEGYLFMRWQGLGRALRADEAPQAELVPIAALRSRLPADTRRVSAEERAEQLRRREAAPLEVARRSAQGIRRR